MLTGVQVAKLYTLLPGAALKATSCVDADPAVALHKEKSLVVPATASVGNGVPASGSVSACVHVCN